MKLRLLLPATLIVASNACFATRNDVRILQEDILSFRTMQARADSARARQLTDLATALNANLAGVRDSVRELGTRLVTFQGSTRQELHTIGQQLLQLGERMGITAAAMQAFRADLEERSRQLTEQAIRQSVPPPAPGDTTTRAAAPPVRMTEGPNVLYQTGRELQSQRAWSAAREAFTKLLTEFPNSDLAPSALANIGESFDAEGNSVQGDSVFRLVVLRYPSHEAASTSLYKLGFSLARQKKPAEARVTMQEVVKKYPGSDAAALATDWLSRNPPF